MAPPGLFLSSILEKQFYTTFFKNFFTNVFFSIKKGLQSFFLHVNGFAKLVIHVRRSCKAKLCTGAQTLHSLQLLRTFLPVAIALLLAFPLTYIASKGVLCKPKGLQSRAPLPFGQEICTKNWFILVECTVPFGTGKIGVPR